MFTYDIIDEYPDVGPFVAEAEVTGLYPPEVAVVAGRATACNTGSTTIMDD